MRHIVRIGWIGLAISATAGAIGLACVVGSALAAGDWWLARQPWIGFGLTLLVPGLAGAAGFALLLDVVEPIGRWRLLAVPPALLVGGFWALVLVVGLPTTGGTDFDVATILYSLPMTLAVLVIATIALALPAIVGRGSTRRVPPTST
jgi:hypothetical protein